MEFLLAHAKSGMSVKKEARCSGKEGALTWKSGDPWWNGGAHDLLLTSLDR